MTIRLLSALAGAFPDIETKELYARILCGEVLVNGVVWKDPRAKVSPNYVFTFRDRNYVSRGGEKLAGALRDHRVDPRGKVVLDAGASTGGFTECLLDRGAAYVHAVDVGYNQLDYSLRRRPDVAVHERTNIMQVSALHPCPDFAVADLSFRSLRGAAKHILGLVEEEFLLALVKPQFEWGDPDPSFDGVVRREADLSAILLDLARDLLDEGVAVAGASESPVTGRRGNREFFFSLRPSRYHGCESPSSLIHALFRSGE
jgi:23S rRNA (cytidine1920-2'-O)/16S rRNA (cytidine1409-2'-O)-methyltransferase